MTTYLRLIDFALECAIPSCFYVFLYCFEGDEEDAYVVAGRTATMVAGAISSSHVLDRVKRSSTTLSATVTSDKLRQAFEPSRPLFASQLPEDCTRYRWRLASDCWQGG